MFINRYHKVAMPGQCSTHCSCSPFHTGLKASRERKVIEKEVVEKANSCFSQNLRPELKQPKIGLS